MRFTSPPEGKKKKKHFCFRKVTFVCKKTVAVKMSLKLARKKSSVFILFWLEFEYFTPIYFCLFVIEKRRNEN